MLGVIEKDAIKREGLIGHHHHHHHHRHACVEGDNTIKRAGWPLEAAVIIKPWASNLGRHHSDVRTSSSSSSSSGRSSPSNFDVKLVTMMIRMLMIGVIIKVRWSPGL